MSSLSNKKINNAELLVNLAYLRTEYASQNTYYATMRMAFAMGLVSAYTKNLYVLGFSIILLIGGFIQYKFMGNILININELSRNGKKNIDYNEIYKLREFNNLIFIFYTVIFIIAILLQFKYDKKKFFKNIIKNF